MKDLSANRNSYAFSVNRLAVSEVSVFKRKDKEDDNQSAESAQSPATMKPDMSNDKVKPLSFSISRLLSIPQNVDDDSDDVKTRARTASSSSVGRDGYSDDLGIKSSDESNSVHNQLRQLKSLHCVDTNNGLLNGASNYPSSNEISYFTESRCDLLHAHTPSATRSSHPCNIQQYPFTYQWLKRPSTLPSSYPVPRSSLFSSHNSVSVGYPLTTLAWMSSSRGKPRRGMMRRAVFSDAQRQGLEKRFQLTKYINKPDRKSLAEELGLKDSQVKIWFQNRRMKWRNSKERELLSHGGSREQTLPTKNNPNPDLTDVGLSEQKSDHNNSNQYSIKSED